MPEGGEPKAVAGRKPMVAADPAAFLHARFVRMRTKCEFLSKDRRRRARSVGRMESNGRSRSCGFPASPMCAHAHKIQVPFRWRKDENLKRLQEGQRWPRPIQQLSCAPEMCACAQIKKGRRCRKTIAAKSHRWTMICSNTFLQIADGKSRQHRNNTQQCRCNMGLNRIRHKEPDQQSAHAE